MSIKPISSKPVSLPEGPTTIPQHTPHQLHHSSLQSLSVQSKEPSTFFTCVKRFFEILCFPFIWLYNLIFRSSAKKEVEETPKPKTLEVTAPTVKQPETNPKLPRSIVKEEIDPKAHPHHIQHPNKLAAYNHLAKDQYVGGGPITFCKYAMEDRSYVSACPLFLMSPEKGGVYCEEGTLPYGLGSTEASHWFANFADQHIMGYCEGGLLAQDEEQVVVHPALYHVKTALKEKGHAYMKDNEVFLLKNVSCMGIFDTVTPVAPGKPSLYGNAFARAPIADIHAKLHPQHETKSNIFYIAARHIPYNLAGKPYQKEDLERLFYTAYTAFFGIKEQSLPGSATYPIHEVHIHTGNWGAGAFGNLAKVSHLMQLAAARAAGVTAHFYPLNKKDDFYAAQTLFNDIEHAHPNMSVDQFLDHLTENAATYGLVYGVGNGT